MPTHATWFPRLLYRLSLLLAAALMGLVIAAPWLDNRMSSRLLAVFAHDATLRRTAVASALGLVVTARVFFWSPGAPRRVPPKERKLPPPPTVAGA